MSSSNRGSSRVGSPLFTEGSSYSTSTPPSSPPSEHRWSELVPPKTGLKFALVWDSEDLVAFTSAELEDSPTEDMRLSPSDACSQVLTIGQSTLPLSENTATMQFFRENLDAVFGADSANHRLDREHSGRTQTSSTLGGLDVYLRGSMLGQTHRNNRRFSFLDKLDGQFDFDPRTPFARKHGDGEKEIVDDAVTDEGFYEVEIAPRQRQKSTERSARRKPNARTADHFDSTLLTSNFVSIETDDASSIWSNLEAPDSSAYTGLGSKDQQPRVQRRLRKPRPAEMPAPPLEVLQREVFSHQVSLPPRVPQAKRSKSSSPQCTKPQCTKNLGSLVRCVSRKNKPIPKGDQWVCVEISQEVRRQHM